MMILSTLVVMGAVAASAQLPGTHPFVALINHTLPNNIRGWEKLLELELGEVATRTSHLVKEANGTLEKTVLATTGVKVEWWTQLARPYRGFPAAYTFTGTDTFMALGIQPSLYADVVQPEYLIKPGVYSVGADCYDIGCTQITLTFDGDQLQTIRWVYPID